MMTDIGIMTSTVGRNIVSMNDDEFWACPKCGHVSGDSWEQCARNCPLEQSPHFNQETHLKYDFPVPYKTPSAPLPDYLQ
jgi:hypothetical protein